MPFQRKHRTDVFKRYNYRDDCTKLVLSVSLYSQISTTLKLDSFFGIFWISYKTLYSKQKTKLNLVIFQVVFTVSSFVCNLMVLYRL